MGSTARRRCLYPSPPTAACSLHGRSDATPIEGAAGRPAPRPSRRRTASAATRVATSKDCELTHGSAELKVDLKHYSSRRLARETQKQLPRGFAAEPDTESMQRRRSRTG